jgi:hypothetical protein
MREFIYVLIVVVVCIVAFLLVFLGLVICLDLWGVNIVSDAPAYMT